MVYPAASKENDQADKLFPHGAPASPESKLGLFGLMSTALGSAQTHKAQTFQAQGD